MFDQRQLVARGAAIVLMFASFGYAQADDANEYHAEVLADLELADGTPCHKRLSRDNGALELIDEAVTALLAECPDRDAMVKMTKTVTS